MTTKKITRTFELTIEQNERLIIQRERTFFEWCAVCQNRESFASLEAIGRRFGVSPREVFRVLENETWGFTESAEGELRICLKCCQGILFQKGVFQ